MNSKKDNRTPKAPRTALSIDAKKAYENWVKEISAHNQQLLESIVAHCPEGHVIVVSRNVEPVDPRKWLTDDQVRKETEGMCMFCPGEEMDLKQIFTESVIRRFWYIPVED